MTPIPAAPESLAPKLARCRAEVDAAFARVAAFLDETRPGVTVHTADLAHKESPWFLAYRREAGKFRLLVICGISDPIECAWDFADAEPAARLATLSHLPELLARIGSAATVLARAADRAGETIGQVDAALKIARGEG